MLLALLLGCAPEAHWAATREACGLADGDVAGWPTVDPYESWPMAYDATCAFAMGDDLGVRWGDFPNADLPGAMDGDPLERLLAGAWMLLAGEFGTVGDLAADPVLPTRFGEELADLAAALEVPDDAPGARILYEYVANAVDAVAYRDEGAEDVDSMASFGRRTGTLRLCDSRMYREATWLGAVVHEASHHLDRPHVDCDGQTGMDADWEGAFGVESFVVLRWGENVGDASDARFEWLALEGAFCADAAIPEDVDARFHELRTW